MKSTEIKDTLRRIHKLQKKVKRSDWLGTSEDVTKFKENLNYLVYILNPSRFKDNKEELNTSYETLRKHRKDILEIENIYDVIRHFNKKSLKITDQELQISFIRSNRLIEKIIFELEFETIAA